MHGSWLGRDPSTALEDRDSAIKATMCVNYVFEEKM